MKPPLLLAGSAIINLVLVTVFLLRPSTPPSTSAVSETPERVSKNAKADELIAANTWPQLDVTEPADFVARLRAEGFPPELVRAMTRAFVQKHFRARYEALAQAEAAKPFWRGESGRHTVDPAINAERRAVVREVQAMMEQLLGAEAFQQTDDQLAALQQRFGPLPTTKLTKLQRIVSDYTDLTREVSDVANGILLPEDRAKLALMQKEREADIAALLSPEEFFEYELHHSSTANRVTQQLSAFDATEQEYRALFALNRSVDATHGNPGVLTPEQRRVRADALKQLTPQIEAALGPERFAAYQQAIEPAYQQIFQLVTRLELPVAAAAEVVSLQKDMEQRATAFRTNRTWTAGQRQAEFAALNREATERLTATLGAPGVEAYKNTGAAWLQNLQRSAGSNAAPK